MAAPMSSEGIVTVSYKTYRNTYQISQYVSFVEKVYRYTPIIQSITSVSHWDITDNVRYSICRQMEYILHNYTTLL